MGTFDRLPSWLVDALQLQDPDVPNVLGGKVVQPTLDVLQGGWGLRTGETFWELFEGDVPASQAAGTEVVIAADPGRIRLCTLGEMNFQGGALGDWLISIVQSTTAKGTALFEDTAVADQRYTWKDLNNGDYWIVPPGWRLIMQHPATGVGEQITFRTVALDLPAGFKPI